MFRRILLAALVAGGLLVAVPASAPPPARAVIATTPVVVIAGDSTAANSGLGVPDRFAARLGERLCAQRRICGTVTSYACGGQRLASPTEGIATSATACVDPVRNRVVTLESQWQFILNLSPQPTTILVLIGFNDAFTPDDQLWTTAYRKLVTDAAALGIRVLPCVMLAVPAAFGSYNVVANPLYWWGLWLVDTFGADTQRTDIATQVNPGDRHMNPAYDSGDHVHPGPAGTDAMARYIDLSRIV